MNLLKLLTKSGRQTLVREAATEYLTPDKIAELAADGVAKMLEAGADKLSDDRCAQIAIGCEKGGNALIHITGAISPEGEDGKKVSAQEKAQITSDIRSALSNLLTDEAVADAINKGVALVP